MPKSAVIHGACGCLLVTAIIRSFWHACGTDADIRDGCQLTAPEAVGRLLCCPLRLRRHRLPGPRLVRKSARAGLSAREMSCLARRTISVDN